MEQQIEYAEFLLDKMLMERDREWTLLKDKNGRAIITDEELLDTVSLGGTTNKQDDTMVFVNGSKLREILTILKV